MAGPAHDHRGMMGGNTAPPTPGAAQHDIHDHDHTSGDGSTPPNQMQHMMQMYFYASEQATILFSPWVTTTWEEMLGSCIGVLIIAILYEGLKAGRLWLAVYANSRNATVTVYNNGSYVERSGQQADHSENGGVKQPMPPVVAQPLTWTMKSTKLSFHIIQSVLHMIQVGVGYLLMLISMTFNAYLFISVVIGFGLGYLIFNFKRPIIVDGNEHCH